MANGVFVMRPLSEILRPSGPFTSVRLRAWLLLGVIVVFLIACEAKQSPAEVVRSFMIAVESLDAARAESLVCQAQRAGARESLAPLGDVARAGETFDMNFDELVIQEQSNDGEFSIVLVRGQLTFFFLGQEDTQAIDETHTVVKESGRWVVCDP